MVDEAALPLPSLLSLGPWPHRTNISSHTSRGLPASNYLLVALMSFIWGTSLNFRCVSHIPLTLTGVSA